MTDWMTIAFIVCVITALLGTAAVWLRKKKQIRLFYGLSLLSLLIVVVLMAALSVSNGL